MKKTSLGLILFSSLMIGAGATAFAAESSIANSDGTVTLSKDTKPVDPVDPGDGGDGDATGNDGPLTIDYVPKFNFVKDGGGISGNFKDTTIASGHIKNVQVSDKTGAKDGWTLSLKMEPFKDGDKILKGAQINFGTRIEAGSTKNVSEEPTTTPVVNLPINDASDTTTNISIAAKGAGAGTWLTRFDTSSLEIPEGNAIGDYTSTFVWTVASTPSV